MRVCITATGNSLASSLDPRFGRAMYFLIVDDKGKLLKVIKNPGIEAMRGAGISAAQVMAEEKVEAVITGNVGPNAYMVLGNSGIKILFGSPGMRVRDVFQEYQKGSLQEAREAMPCGPAFGQGPGRGRGGRIGRRGRRPRS